MHHYEYKGFYLYKDWRLRHISLFLHGDKLNQIGSPFKFNIHNDVAFKYQASRFRVSVQPESKLEDD